MAEFKVSTAKLTEEAARQRQKLNGAEQLVAQTKSDITTYLNMWEGEAKQSFVRTSNQYLNLIDNFLSETEQYQRALDAAVSVYENSERTAKRIASQKGQ